MAANVVKIEEISKPNKLKIKSEMWGKFLGVLINNSMIPIRHMHRNVYLYMYEINVFDTKN